MTAAADLATLDLVDVQLPADERIANAERRSDLHHPEECLLCGRGLTAAAVERGWWVHLATTGVLVAVDLGDLDERDDQGWFPVGSDCARRVPPAFRSRSAG